MSMSFECKFSRNGCEILQVNFLTHFGAQRTCSGAQDAAVSSCRANLERRYVSASSKALQRRSEAGMRVDAGG